MTHQVTMQVNGRVFRGQIEARTLLVHFLRDQLGLTGTHIGCDTSSCGACTVLVDGSAVKSCTLLAVQCAAAEITTIEGLAASPDELHPVQRSFRDCHGLQCGFCTPGMILASVQLLERNPAPTESEIRHGLEGNLCRCTGYQNIIEAVQQAARGWRRDEAGPAAASGAAQGSVPAPAAATSETGRPKYVGQPVRRREDARFMTGRARYVDDVRLADVLHVEIVRSPYAHARIRGIDVTQARSLPGVIGVYTHADLCSLYGPVPVVNPAMPDLRVPERFPLADGEVCFVGQPVVAIVAENRYVSADAASLIDVDYDPLPVVVDPEVAIEPGATAVHSSIADNVAFRWGIGKGDIDGAFAAADVVIEQRITGQRLIPCAMETRGVVACYLPGEKELTVWTSTQSPYMVRTHLAAMLRLPENRLRVVVPDVGGGFGSKLNVYAEEGLVSALALLLAPRPVKWIESRRENMAGTTHGRDQIGHARLAARRDGRILGIRYDALADLGAYHQLYTPRIPTLTGRMLSGCYAIPAARVSVVGVFTDKMSTDAYRGAGRPEGAFVIERMIDLLARELRIDPVAVRRANFIREFPFSTATDVTYDSGDYDKALDRLLELADYQGAREAQKTRRARGELVGIGLSTYVEISGMGPSRMMAISAWEAARVTVNREGTVEVVTGVCPHGQGTETAFMQLVADELGIGLEKVKVYYGDTARLGYGTGTFASRGAAVGGTAVLEATRRIAAKLKTIAAGMLNVGQETVVFGEDVLRAGDKSIPFAEVCYQAHRANQLPHGVGAGLEETFVFEPTNFLFPFGAHFCQVCIDPDTAEVRLERFYAVDDCGKVLNPLLVDGQIHGGIAQGIGQALYEAAVYDDEGQLLTGSFLDYAVPRAAMMPWFHCDRTETPTLLNPLGAKGIGESGTIGATPAVVNAVMDALSPFGIRHIDMPLRPETLWRTLRKGAVEPGEAPG